MNISAYALMRADFCITPIRINSGSETCRLNLWTDISVMKDASDSDRPVPISLAAEDTRAVTLVQIPPPDSSYAQFS